MEERLKDKCYEKDITRVFINSDVDKDKRVRLFGSAGPHEGNVFVGEVPVCDAKWDEADAMVVCRQLGYGFVKKTVGSEFGLIAAETFYFRSFGLVNCTGSEVSLGDCGHNETWCLDNQGAGVVCDGGRTEHLVPTALDCQNL